MLALISPNHVRTIGVITLARARSKRRTRALITCCCLAIETLFLVYFNCGFVDIKKIPNYDTVALLPRGGGFSRALGLRETGNEVQKDWVVDLPSVQYARKAIGILPAKEPRLDD